MAEYTVFNFFSHLTWKTAEFVVKFSTVLNKGAAALPTPLVRLWS